MPKSAIRCGFTYSHSTFLSVVILVSSLGSVPFLYHIINTCIACAFVTSNLSSVQQLNWPVKTGTSLDLTWRCDTGPVILDLISTLFPDSYSRSTAGTRHLLVGGTNSIAYANFLDSLLELVYRAATDVS